MPFPYEFPFYFDPIPEAGLIDHQADHSVIPYIKLELTKEGATPYTIEINPMRQIDVHIDPYRDSGEFLLENGNKYFSDIDLKQYNIVYSFGLKIGSTISTISLPAQVITEQQFLSQKGIALCKVNSKGKISLLREDHASQPYYGGGNAKVLIDMILKAELYPYSHCESYEVIWDNETQLEFITVYSPSESFYIRLNKSRFDAVHQLLNMSNAVMRIDTDGRIHIVTPVTSGSNYAREFSLNEHVFFWLNEHNKLAIPNAVKVTCTKVQNQTAYKPDGTPYQVTTTTTYSGEATQTEDFEYYPAWYFVEAEGLASDAEAENMAQGILDAFIQSESKGSVQVPVNFYAQLHDYIRITDKRRTADIAQLENSNDEDVYSQITYDIYRLAQTFVPVTDIEVNSLWLFLARSGNTCTLNISIHNVLYDEEYDEETITDEILFETSIDNGLLGASGIPSWYKFSFDSVIQFEAGKHYGIVVHSPDGDSGSDKFVYVYFNAYIFDDGTMYNAWKTNGEWDEWNYFGPTDFLFKLSLVSPYELSTNIGSIDWHFSPGKYRQIYSFGGYLNQERSRFKSDYIPKPERVFFEYWHYATLPNTYLLPDQYIIFHQVIVPHYRRFFIGPYSINSNGQGGELRVLRWDTGSETWESLVNFPTREADSENFDEYFEVWDSYDEGGTVIIFMVINTGSEAISGINAMLGYDCQYFPGGLP